MDEAGTIAAVVARLEFAELRITALETSLADIAVVVGSLHSRARAQHAAQAALVATQAVARTNED